jgi:hypothetical protein
MSLRELNSTVDSKEFAHWKAFDRLSPLDMSWRLEVALSIVAAALTPNVGRGSQPDPTNYRVDWGKLWRREVDIESSIDNGLNLDKLDLVMNQLGKGA